MATWATRPEPAESFADWTSNAGYTQITDEDGGMSYSSPRNPGFNLPETAVRDEWNAARTKSPEELAWEERYDLPGLRGGDPAFAQNFMSLLQQNVDFDRYSQDDITGAIRGSNWYGRLGGGSNPYGAMAEVAGRLGQDTSGMYGGQHDSWGNWATDRSSEAAGRRAGPESFGGLGDLGKFALLAGGAAAGFGAFGGAEAAPFDLYGELAAGVSPEAYLSGAAGGGGIPDFGGLTGEEFGAIPGVGEGGSLAPVVERGRDFSGAFTRGTAGSDVMSILRSVLGSSGGGGVLGGSSGASGLGSLSGLANLGTSIYGMYQSEQMKRLAKLAGAQADPWGASGGRSLAAGQLQGVLAGGSAAYEQTPAYKARMQAVQRSMAANGYLGSGNMAVAAANAGGAGYNEYLQMMGGLSGANANPASAAQLELTGNSSANNLAINSLGLLAKTAALRGI